MRKKEQNQVEVNENLNDDELYAKIQTEKLLKRKKNKKIATIASLCGAFVLAVVIILLASIPVSFKPKFAENGFMDVTFYPGTVNSVATISKNDSKYDEFMKLYDKSFNQTVISAIFSGSFDYSIEEKRQNASEIVGSTNGALIKNKNYFVKLRFAEEQTLTYQNGKVYTSNIASSAWDGVLKFTDVFVVVNKTEGLQETKVYAVVYYPKYDDNGDIIENEDKKTTDAKVVILTVKANTYEIYNAWKNFVD